MPTNLVPQTLYCAMRAMRLPQELGEKTYSLDLDIERAAALGNATARASKAGELDARAAAAAKAQARA